MNFPSDNLDFLICRKIHRVFARTSHGQKLRLQVRFGPYKPQNISNKEWEKILGRDVNNLHHMPFTVALTRRFVQKCDNPPLTWREKLTELASFNPDEKRKLLIAAQVHDWAESIIGDIPAILKTQDQEVSELQILKEMVSQLIGKKDKDLALQINNAVDEVIGKRESKLGMAFDAIERIGYYKVALRAWRARNQHDGELKEKLHSLATGPIAPIRREKEKLERYATIYPPVFDFLYSPINQKDISRILAN